MANSATTPSLVIGLSYVVLMAYAVVLGIFSPFYNWDMLCYVASVTAWQGLGADAIFGGTMAALKAAIPDWVYAQHSHNALSVAAHDFVGVLPMCQIKPLYNGSVWLAHRLPGMSLPAATWWVSAISFAVLAVILSRWRSRHFPQSVWLVLVVVLTFVGSLPMSALARLSTPDALCTTLTLAALSVAYFSRSFMGFALFGWLATLARPDAAVCIGALTIYFAASAHFPQSKPVQRGAAAGLLLILFASHLAVDHLAGSYSWEKMFVYTFLNRVPDLAADTTRLTWAGYLGALSGGFAIFIVSARTAVLLGLSVVACFCRFLYPARGGAIHLHLLLLNWGCIAVRFVMWPAWGEDRFYYGYYVPILFFSAELIGPYGNVLWRHLLAYRQSLRQQEAESLSKDA
jgi:hypothetical protein